MILRCSLSIGFLASVAALVVLVPPSRAQNPAPPSGSERGAFLVRNVAPMEYGGFPLTFGAVRDARGVLYVAGGDGVMEYDGAGWRTIAVGAQERALALARDAEGTVFVGANNDLGYLTPDAAGQMRFVSLTAELPERPTPLEVHHVHATREEVVFNLGVMLLRWAEGRFEPIRYAPPSVELDEADDVFGESALVDGRVLVATPEGVAEVRGLEVTVLPGTEPLAWSLIGAARLDARTLLLAEGRRVWRYTDGTLTPFVDPDALGVRSVFSEFVGLPTGGFVVGTSYDGLRFFDAEGRAGWALGEAEGLRDDEIRHLDVDADGRLYVSLINGFAHLDPAPALTVFDDALGVGGQVIRLARHGSALHAGTSTGVYRLAPSAADGIARFDALLDAEAYAFDLRVHDGRLLAATGRGLFDVTSGRDTGPIGGHRDATYALSPSPATESGTPPRLIVGTETDLLGLAFDVGTGSWSAPDTLARLSHGVDGFVERGPFERWASLYPDGLIRLTLSRPGGTDTARTVRVRVFGPDEALPAGRLFPFVFEGALYAQAKSGLIRYDDETQRFAPDTTFGAGFADGARRFVRPTPTGDALWSSTTAGSAEAEHHRFARAASGGYAETLPAAMRLVPPTILWTFLEERGEPRENARGAVVWAATTDRLYRYDARRARVSASRAPLVRRVALGDSALASGADAATTLAPRHPTLRFTFALPVFDAPERTRYSTRLGGFDADWSAWSDETRRDYTNLPGGTYQFSVRARDVYGRVTESDPYAFTVRHPWFQRPWALLLFALLGLGAVFGVVQWRVASLNERARRLEATVAERTATISEQAEQLRALDEAKSRFFANVSHELRTPLALITGPLEALRARHADVPEPLREPLATMERNGHRLSELVDQILKLARIESGALTLDLAPHDLPAFVGFQVGLYDGLAQHRGVALRWDAPPETEPIVAPFEPDAVSKILSNLIGNALKFTPEGGSVTVRVRAEAETARVEVEDTGIGIAADALPHIFDRFYQADDSRTRVYEGTGIGLALAWELARLHGGTLAARSTPGTGSTFTFTLPRPDAEPTRPATLPSRPLRTAPLPDTPPSEITPADDDGDLDRTTVLVVEDNADLRAFIRSVLESDFRVLDAPDGEAGLHLAREALPDLIVTDVMMPRMDGFTLAATLYAAPETAAIPIIALTARATADDHVEGLATGVDAYLTKPFGTDVLRLQARNLIARQHRLRDRLLSRADTADPSNTDVPATDAPDAPTSRFLRDVRAQIEAHLGEPSFNVEALAEALALSRQQLHRRLVAEADATPVTYLRRYRLERAAALLRAKEGTVAEVAYAVGFNSQSYFGKCFREQFGETPSAYAQQPGSA